MFYTQFMLAKKGPLAKVWLAAHWEKKLSKAQVYETDVVDVVNEIMQPKVKMALRTTGHLLLGVVRIYSRKTKYLLADCNEAFLKIKMSFKSGEEERMMSEISSVSGVSASLPEVMQDFDITIPEFSEYDLQKQMRINQSRIDDITLKEDTVPTTTGFDISEDFGGDDFGDRALGLRFGETDAQEIERHRERSLSNHSALAGEVGEISEIKGMEEMGDSVQIELPSSGAFGDVFMGEAELIEEIEGLKEPGAEFEEPHVPAEVEFANGEARLFPADSFALEPLQPSQIEAVSKLPKTKKKRKLIVDEVKILSGEEMKANMSDFSATIQPLDLAPPSKKLMRMVEYGQTDKLFNNPLMKDMVDNEIQNFYKMCCVARSKEDVYDAVSVVTDLELSEVIDLVELPVTQPIPIRLEEIWQLLLLYILLQIPPYHNCILQNNPKMPYLAVGSLEITFKRLITFFVNFYGNEQFIVFWEGDEKIEGFDEFAEVVSPAMTPLQAMENLDTTLIHEEEVSKGEKELEKRIEIKSPELKRRKPRYVTDKTFIDEEEEGEEGVRCSRRTHAILNSINNKLKHSENNEIVFTDLLTKSSSRRTIAQKFYALLELTKNLAIEVQQDEPYGEIIIKPGPQLATILAN
uniref:Rad21/Rec8-like protein N-terminal domain-containing protein n=1 Tax=Strongyloides stercoralis TaxID=6248 RepID=A0AAF5CVP2_STRER